MNTTNNTSIKLKVITLLYRARQQQREFVDGLSEQCIPTKRWSRQ